MMAFLSAPDVIIVHPSPLEVRLSRFPQPRRSPNLPPPSNTATCRGRQPQI